MNLKRTAILAFIFGGLVFQSLNAQKTLNLKEKSGIQTTFQLSSIKKLTFSSGDMTINKLDASNSTYAISAVQNISFSGLVLTDLSSELGFEIDKMSLFPIPAVNELNVRYFASSSSTTQFQIIDLQGKVIFKEVFNSQSGLNNKVISVSNLSHGIYLCRLQNGNKLETSKFLKD